MEADAGTIQFRMHAPEAGEDVSAAVFAGRLSALISALRAADEAVNGKATFDYKIRHLQSSSPTALLYEQPKHPQSGMLARSPTLAFNRCAHDIVAGDIDSARTFGQCPQRIAKVASGAGIRFAYAEIAITDDIVRVDPFLIERARAVYQLPISLAEIGLDKSPWFKGIVHAAFDGRVEAVDLRGSLPEIKLVLSAGHKEIDCVCRAQDIEKIREALNHRVRVSGRAIYDGNSGLPRRIEVTDIELITGGDFSRWKGAFKPFDIPDWESDA